MIGLNRDLAPISARGWERIESEAREVLEMHLAARRLLDFEGPLGWEHSAIDLGRVEAIEGTASDGVRVQKRLVRPLIELRVGFQVERRELEGVDRGAANVDLDALRDAARRFAIAEDSAIFHGYADGEIRGLLNADANRGVALREDPQALPEALSEALEQLRQAGVGGPYAVALGPEPYSALDRSAGDGGYPIVKHVQRLIDGPIVWAPALRGGVVISQRGGDVKFVCGRDVAVGYATHDEKRIGLYLEESFSLELNGPEAIVPLLPPGE